MDSKKLNRRDFLRISALGAGAVMIPSALRAATPERILMTKSPDDLVRLGFIGMGPQGNGLLSEFIKIKGVKVVAGCDLYKIKRDRFEKRVKEYYAANGGSSDGLATYENYKDLLARNDIDAVIIAVPDFWHAFIAIDACKAGKDVYLEKPMTFTIEEGRKVCEAVRQNNRILQVGSQQRSDREFLHAVNMVRQGRLGKITKLHAHVSGGPKPLDLPKEKVPEGLNWEMWNGPLAKPVYYNSELNYPITLDPAQDEANYGGWRWYEETGGGFTTDWGAHMFDIAQWGLGKDLSGPSEIIPPGHKEYDDLTFIYDNGIVVTRAPYNEEKDYGVKFIGEKGWIEVSRGKYNTSIPELEIKGSEDYGLKNTHHGIFIDSVRSRIDPNVPVEVGHSSCTMCNLGNIALKLDRPLQWNPIVQKFVDDAQADKMLSHEYKAGYAL